MEAGQDFLDLKHNFCTALARPAPPPPFKTRKTKNIYVDNNSGNFVIHENYVFHSRTSLFWMPNVVIFNPMILFRCYNQFNLSMLHAGLRIWKEFSGFGSDLQGKTGSGPGHGTYPNMCLSFWMIHACGFRS